MTPLLLLLACTASDPADDTGTTPTTTDGGTELVPTEGELQGQWLVGLTIAPVGNLVISFQAEVEHELLGEDSTLTRVALRASNGEDVSDVLAEVAEVPVGTDGAFTAEFPVLTLPPEFSPTGGEVDVQATLAATRSGAEGFCGDLGGNIVTFDIDLSGSTFGAVPWEQRADGVVASCSTEQPDPLPRMTAEDCPTLVAGDNTGFPSGQVARSFELVLPSTYSDATSWPLVIAFHGLGGEADGLLAYGLRDMADAADSIVIAPDATELGGSIVWDAVSDELANIDVLLFDDLLTCAGAQLAVDSDRIYVTGMSNGGLMTGKLLSLRGDVLAAAAPLSGGVLGTWPDTPAPPPTLVVWGGKKDLAVDQDFNGYALDMLEELAARDTFAVACDHGTGHTLDASYWPWVFRFFADHPRGSDLEYPDGLPEEFPEYCVVAD